MPRSRGGADVQSNTVWSCAGCNTSKRSGLLLEWVMVRAGVWKHANRSPGVRYRMLPHPRRRPAAYEGSIERMIERLIEREPRKRGKAR
ncbi:MAG: hypothetical protein M3Z05_15465 [Gemmatimonadota bacterium]|nr:hypothetical protein [Gemmatimonadota bacterium]